jgi:glycosyltransferase involved in cell wall biosynthesis
VQSLIKLGIDVKVFIGERPRIDYWIKKLDEHNVEYYYPDEFTEDLRARTIEKKFVIEVRRILKSWNPDIIHTNPPGKMIVSWLELCGENSIPIVATEWTMPSKNTAHWYPEELHKFINKIDVMIATCNRLVDGIKNYHGYSGRLEVVPHLILKQDYVKEEFSNNTLYSVGCVSRLSPEKGLDYLLGAWEKVVKLYPNATLHIYGHGEEERHLKGMVEALGLKENVFFEGIYEPIIGIENIAYKHQIYVQPSLFESIPTSIIELMGRGRIIVASDVGGVSELISNDGKNGVLVPRASTDSIFESLIKLFQDEELRLEIKEKASRLFYERYNIEFNIDKIVSIYRSLMRRKDLL